MLSIDNFATGRRDNLARASAPDRDRRQHRRSGTGRAHCSPTLRPTSWCTPPRPTRIPTTGIPMRWSMPSVPPISPRPARSHNVRRLIYFQTALCYGTKPLQSPIRLDHPINPVNSSYAISKTAGEHYVQFSGVDWVTFRLANVIGPRNVSGPLPIFYRAAVGGKALLRDAGAARLLLRRRSRRGRRARRRRRRARAPITSRPARTWRSRSSTTPSSAR